MIDTIKLAIVILEMPQPAELVLRGWRQQFDQNTGKLNGWYYKEKVGSKYPYLHLFTAPDGITYLSVRISLPAFIFGSNVSLLQQTQVDEGFDDLSEYIKGKSGFDFDAKRAFVWEVHFARDYYVGEGMMHLALSRVAEMDIPTLKAGKYAGSSAYFHSKGKGKEYNKPRTLCIYDKHTDCVDKSFSETDIKKAEGMMRVEMRYNTPDAVRRLAKKGGCPNTEAQTLLTQELSDFVIEPIQNSILTLLEETNAPECIVKLTKAYGKRRAARLIHYLVNLHLFGMDFYRNKTLGFTRTAYYACRKECRELGIHFLFDTLKAKIQVADVP